MHWLASMVALSAIHDFEQDIMDTDQNDSPDQALMQFKLRVLLERKLDALPEAFRIVYRMRCVEEAAACLGIPKGTIATFSSTDHRRRRSGPVNISITSCLVLVKNTVVFLPVIVSG